MALIAAMLGAEIHSIRSDRATNDAQQKNIRDAESEKFNQIAQGLKDSIDIGKGQYSSTITHVDSVLTTTQRVANLSTTTLLNITGGNSFAYVIPASFVLPPGYSKDTEFTMELYNAGSQTLTGVSIFMTRVVSSSEGIEHTTDPTTFNVGTAASGHRQVLTEFGKPYYMHPSPNDDGIATYNITIQAQNGSVKQVLRFRPSINGEGWATAFVVMRIDKNPKVTGRTLCTQDWKEPVILDRTYLMQPQVPCTPVS